MMNFCTLFDSYYIHKGIALYLSLERVCDDFTLYVMAFDEPSYKKLSSLNFKHMVVEYEGGEFLSTSGDYEKYFMEDGKRYHHILDPKTGYPVWNGLDSVTVVCDSGLLADGLSSACFVLGMDDALELLEKYNAEAVFVDEDKNVYLTSGMKDRFELMKNTYTVKELQ